MTRNMYWKRILAVIIIGLGLTIVLPATAQTRSRTKVHTVQAKETVYSLARQYGLTEEDIYTLNPSAKGGIKEGQTLLIPAKSIRAVATYPAPPSGEHVILPQETLYSVSRKYGLSEEALLKANPGISAANFPAGHRLRIPRGESAPVSTSPTVQTGKAIEVGLMLPLSGNIQRYVEFYEGMLMGLIRLKKKGVSVTLRVYDVSNTSDAEDVVHSGELNDCHLIIGGTSNDQISVIGRYADRRGINYVVPFSSEKIAGKAYPNLFQINPPARIHIPLRCPRIHAPLCRSLRCFRDRTRRTGCLCLPYHGGDGQGGTLLHQSRSRYRTGRAGEDAALGLAYRDHALPDEREFSKQTAHAGGQ